MPPQPVKNMASVYGDAQIPGTALPNELHMNTNMSLRTHSSKFPVNLTLFQLLPPFSPFAAHSFRSRVHADRARADFDERQSVDEDTADARGAEDAIRTAADSCFADSAPPNGINCARSSAKASASLGKSLRHCFSPLANTFRSHRRIAISRTQPFRMQNPLALPLFGRPRRLRIIQEPFASPASASNESVCAARLLVIYFMHER